MTAGWTDPRRPTNAAHRDARSRRPTGWRSPQACPDGKKTMQPPSQSSSTKSVHPRTASTSAARKSGRWQHLDVNCHSLAYRRHQPVTKPVTIEVAVTESHRPRDHWTRQDGASPEQPLPAGGRTRSRPGLALTDSCQELPKTALSALIRGGIASSWS